MKQIHFLILLFMVPVFCFAQTKQDTLTLQQAQYKFQSEINKTQQLEAELKEQKAKAFDAWTEYQKSLMPFQQQVQEVQQEEKKNVKGRQK